MKRLQVGARAAVLRLFSTHLCMTALRGVIFEQARTSNFSTVTAVAHVGVCYTIKAYTLRISTLSMALVVILMFLPGVVFFWCRTMISRWSWDFSDLSLILLISIGGEAHDRQGRIWGHRLSTSCSDWIIPTIRINSYRRAVPLIDLLAVEFKWQTIHEKKV